MEAVRKVQEFIEDAKVFYLATVENDQPRVRVYGANLLYEDNLYVMAFNRGDGDRQIKANPKVEICAFKGKQLRLTCELVEDPRAEVRQAMVDKMPALKNMLGNHGEDCVMYKVTKAHATIADLAGHSESYDF